MKILKEVEKILNNPKDVSFDKTSKILTFFGYKLDRVNGSHHVFIKEKSIIVIPKNNPVKIVYIKNMINELNLGGWYERNK